MLCCCSDIGFSPKEDLCKTYLLPLWCKKLIWKSGHSKIRKGKNFSDKNRIWIDYLSSWIWIRSGGLGDWNAFSTYCEVIGFCSNCLPLLYMARRVTTDQHSVSLILQILQSLIVFDWVSVVAKDTQFRALKAPETQK